MKSNNSFLVKKIWTSLPPIMLSVLGGTANNIIDSVFVSRALNTESLAALSLALPMYLVLCTAGSLLGYGASVNSSLATGKHDNEAATRYYNSGFFTLILASVLIAVIGLLFSGGISVLLCNDAAMRPLVASYVRVLLAGSLPFILIYLPTYYLNLDGRGRELLVMMSIMIATDILFDLLFLIIFKLGLNGAVLASIFSTLTSCIYGLVMLQRTSSLFRLKLSYMKFYNLYSIAKYGFTSALGNLADSVCYFFLNYIVYLYGGTQGLAVWTVINSVSEFSLCITSGVPITVSPLMGFYFSGHDHENVRKLLKLELYIGSVMATAFALALVVLNRPLTLYFDLDTTLLIPMICLGLYVISESFCSIFCSYYNLINETMLSVVTSFLRTFFFPLSIAVILLRANLELWYFLPLASIATVAFALIASLIISLRHRKPDHNVSPIYLLDDYYENANISKGYEVASNMAGICDTRDEVIQFCLEKNMAKNTAGKLGLSLEDVMSVMCENALDDPDSPIDVRVYSDDGTIGISMMCFGKKYDPFESADTDAKEEDEDFILGAKLIDNISKNCYYTYTMGINVIIVEF